MNIPGKKRIFGIWLTIALIIGYLLLVVLVPQQTKTAFKSGDSIAVQSPSFIASAKITKCTISISSRTGKTAEVELMQDWFVSPLLVLPSAQDDIFYCIYDHDTDFLILKINLARKFQIPPKDQPTHTIVVSSSCRVDRVRNVDTNDWTEVNTILAGMPPDQYRRQAIGGLRLGFARIITAQDVVLAELRNYGKQAGYNRDSVAP